MISLLVCVLAVALCTQQVLSSPQYYALKGKQSWQVVSQDAPPQGFVARAILTQSVNTTGWDTLDLSTAVTVDDHTQAYGAGYLEGFITRDLIWNWWVNTIACDGATPSPVYDFIVKNEQWIQSQIANCMRTGNCAYWRQVELLLLQLDGMTDGYNNATTNESQRLTRLQLLGRNTFDEWEDIMTAVNKTRQRPTDPASVMMREHCSVLVKVTDDLQSIYTAHVTWGHFCHSLRIFKHYRLNYKIMPSAVSFSSFPGALLSGDDYYINDKGLAITETTNDVFDARLFANVTVHTVPFWIRVTLAARIAASGEEWVKVFSLFNSGTYNNQWQIVDMKLFTPGKPLRPNLLWVAEQIPGYVVSADMTSKLAANKYFPSYNVPMFEFIYNISGYPAQYNQYGDEYSYEKCPRANIFRRDQGKVKTLDDFKNIMRYNDYKNDPLSLGNACNGISARCDLNPKGGKFKSAAFGGYDCKVTDNALIKTMTTHALSGPSSETLPPFAWSQWPEVSHIGQPPVYDFPFVEMKPKL